MDQLPPLRPQLPPQRKTITAAHNCKQSTINVTWGGKQHREEMSDDESEYDENWESMRRGGAPFNELLAA